MTFINIDNHTGKLVPMKLNTVIFDFICLVVTHLQRFPEGRKLLNLLYIEYHGQLQCSPNFRVLHYPSTELSITAEILPYFLIQTKHREGFIHSDEKTEKYT